MGVDECTRAFKCTYICVNSVEAKWLATSGVIPLALYTLFGNFLSRPGQDSTSQHWDGRCMPPCLTLHMSAGIKLRFLCLEGKYFSSYQSPSKITFEMCQVTFDMLLVWS